MAKAKRKSKSRGKRRARLNAPKRLKSGRFAKSGGAKRVSHRRSRRRVARRNPAIGKIASNYVGGLAKTPGNIMGIFKGRGAMKNGLFAAGGAVATYMLGGIAGAKLTGPLLGRLGVRPDGIVDKAVGVLLPYTIGYVGSRFVKSANTKKALLVGGGLASLIELIAPGKMRDIVGRIPGISALQSGAAGPGAAAMAQEAAAGPDQTQTEGIGQMMLAGYVDAPGYSGTAGYVDAPGYSGTAGYVDAPSYAGTGEDMMLAGDLGSEMLAGNYLEESGMFQPAI
jgi:hypothetical protein